MEQEQPLQKINEEINSRTENVLPETQTVASEQQQPTNLQSEIENMEVHHPHLLTHKKKWAEYLLEFFMLFLVRKQIYNHYYQRILFRK
jgi:hypothetical protein